MSEKKTILAGAAASMTIVFKDQAPVAASDLDFDGMPRNRRERRSWNSSRVSVAQDWRNDWKKKLIG